LPTGKGISYHHRRLASFSPQARTPGTADAHVRSSIPGASWKSGSCKQQTGHDRFETTTAASGVIRRRASAIQGDCFSPGEVVDWVVVAAEAALSVYRARQDLHRPAIAFMFSPAPSLLALWRHLNQADRGCPAPGA
jgi:hypothetical protein